MTEITVSPIPAFQDNYFWLISRSDGNESIVIDPGDAGPVLAYLHKYGLNLAAILITHHHMDHIGGIQKLSAQFPAAPVYGPRNESIPGIKRFVAEGDRIRIAGFDLEFDVFAVPGHTLDHIAYYINGDHNGFQPHLFCGDTLFSVGCGRLFEGSPSQMHQSLDSLSSLAPETLVYCAHEYTLANIQFAKLVDPDNPDLIALEAQVKQWRAENKPSLPSTLERELAVNPFLRTNALAVRQAAEKHIGHALDTALDVFTVIRGWKDKL